MFRTVKEVDEHVQRLMGKLPPGHERNMKGLAMAKLYVKVQEYAKAIEYIHMFLKIDDDPAAHNLLATCYKHLKIPDRAKALQHYRRSLQLKPGQRDVIINACQILLDDNSLAQEDVVKFWCDLAKQEKLSDNKAVFGLSLKKFESSGDGNVNDKCKLEKELHIELKDHPQDIRLHIQLLQMYLEQKKIKVAFTHALELEMGKNEDAVEGNLDWYTTIWELLSKMDTSREPKIDWQYWQMVFHTIERIIVFKLEDQGNLLECTSYIFQMDQFLHKYNSIVGAMGENPRRELHAHCIEHYTGQWLLHVVSLLFKQELYKNKNKWKETLRLALPLAFLSYQLVPRNICRPPAFNQFNSEDKRLLNSWYNDRNFRQAQLGRTLLSCVLEEETSSFKMNQSEQFSQLPEAKQPTGMWENSDTVLSCMRQVCADKEWRRNMFRHVFSQPCHKLKERTSYFLTNIALEEPQYEWPAVADIESYELEALAVRPQSLQHHVYLCMSNENLAQTQRVVYYTDMQLESKHNLPFCGFESLCKLDVDSFLYATTLQAKRKLRVERENYDNLYKGNYSAAAKPYMLPFVNIFRDLATEDQVNWWILAYRLYNQFKMDKNRGGEQRAQLHMGLEAVRGINFPRADIQIIFGLGELLVSRAEALPQNNCFERQSLEVRIESLYHQGFNMLKRHFLQEVDSSMRIFKYENPHTKYACDFTDQLIEDAVVYSSKRYFKELKYDEFIEEMRGLKLPMAMYMQAEAFRLLEENKSMPRTPRIRYIESRMDCLLQTQKLLQQNPKHPLNCLLENELRRCTIGGGVGNARLSINRDDTLAPITNSATTINNEVHNNSSAYEDAYDELFAGTGNGSHSVRRSTAIEPVVSAAVMQSISELGNTMKQMRKTLFTLKDDVASSMDGMRQEIKSLSNKIDAMEETYKKLRISSAQRDTPTRDIDAAAAAALGLEDLFIIDDDQQHLGGTLNAQPNVPLAFNAGGNNYNSLQTPLQFAQSHINSQERFFTPPSGSLSTGRQQQQDQQQLGGPVATQPNMAPPLNAGANFYNGMPPPMQQVNTPERFFTPQTAGSSTYPSSPFVNQLPYGQYMAPSQYGRAPNAQLYTARPGLYGMPNISGIQNMYPSAVNPSYLDPSGGAFNSYGMPPPMNVPPPTAPIANTATLNAAPPFINDANKASTGFYNNASLSVTPAPAPVPTQVSTPAVPTVGITTSIGSPMPAISVTTTVPTAATSTANSNVASLFNRALNNQPVDKEPPANVVITSSDPLPKPVSSGASTANLQPTLSVTIPSQHLKSSGPFNFNVGGSKTTTDSSKALPNIFGTPSSSSSTATTVLSNTTTTTATKTSTTTSFSGVLPIINSSTFSFKPQVAQAAAQREKELAEAANADNEQSATLETSAQNDNSLNKSTGSDLFPELEYDPRPDFKPVIPLPDEVEVRTGEEDDEIIFCHRAKLHRLVDKEWKERGIGDIKILKSKTGQKRIIMRRDVTFKICANHIIVPNLKISLSDKDKDSKSLLWVANDFADGVLNKEKFCLRFKDSAKALEFKKEFEKAVNEANTKTNENSSNNQSQVINSTKQTFAPLSETSTNVFLTSTPAHNPIQMASSGTKKDLDVNITVTKSLFGPPTVTETGKTTTSTKASTNATSAVSPFANLNFGSASLSNKPESPGTIFGNINFGSNFTNNATPFNFKFTSNNDNVKAASNENNKSSEGIVTSAPAELSKSNTSDAEDEYVPTAYFAPVIPLPELVEVRTGEENEIELFKHRAKLLRFDKTLGEWKERGLGDIKLMRDKNNVNQVRLIMRREQVHKLCCNQRLNKDTKFTLMKNSNAAISWAGQDFAEEELSTELLCLRFKTQEICGEFHQAVLNAQANMTDSLNSTSVTDIEEDDECEDPLEDESSNIANDTAESSNLTNVAGFGDKFKPKEGSWNCTACYTVNNESALKCACCETPKESTSVSFENKEESTKNKLGGGDVILAPTTKLGFGDKFKPKEGSWNCPGCYTVNNESALKCACCETPKESTSDSFENKEDSTKNKLGGGGLILAPTTKFSFGFGGITSNPQNTTAPSFDFSKSITLAATATTPTNTGFGFNLPTTTAANSTSNAFSFGVPVTSTAATSPFNIFSSPVVTATKSENSIFSSQPFSFKPPTSSSSHGLPTINSSSFKFAMPSKSESSSSIKPQNSPTSVVTAVADAAGEDDNVEEQQDAEEDENNSYFAPVIPLPDKIDVKTGEEDEEVLYVHRARLYRLTNGDWKERGTGNVKILRHKITKKLRVVMRRDQVHKICLNHALNKNVVYKAKDEKSWLFVVHDFSEGETHLERFTIRFKNPEISDGFHEAIQNALNGSAVPIVEQPSEALSPLDSSSTNQPQSPAIINEIKELAEKLHLSYDFLIEENKCAGCRGCDPDKFQFDWPAAKSTTPSSDLPLTLPALKMPTARQLILKPAHLGSPLTSKSSIPSSFSFVAGGLGNSTPLSVESPQNPISTEIKNVAVTKPTAGSSFFFGNVKPIFGQTNLLGGNNLFSNNSNADQQNNIFGGFNEKTTAEKQPTGDKKLPIGGTANTPLFGSLNTNITSPLVNKTSYNSSTISSTTGNTLADFASKSDVDFASLIAKNAGNTANAFQQKSDTGGFIGLTHQHAFKNFMQPNQNNNSHDDPEKQNDSNGNDENYDPQYEPIIALPEEVSHSTGEENEIKLFGERAKLFRFDANSKEWKERGVGELKILEHPELKSFRMIMRREQIHKLVLNMKLDSTLKIDYMNNSRKNFVWAHFNYAESDNGEVERLACRFKHDTQANEFYKIVNSCKDRAQESQEEVSK